MQGRFFWALGLATALPIILIPLMFAGGLLANPGPFSPVGILFAVAGAHIASTLWFHADADYAEVRKKHWFRMIGALVAIPGALVLVSILWPAIMTPILAAYMAWQAHHYSRQNFGVLSFASARDGFGKLPPSVGHFVTATTFIGAPGMMTWVSAFGISKPFAWMAAPTTLHLAQAVSILALFVSGALLCRLILTEPKLRQSPTLLTFLVLTWLFFVPVLTATGMVGAFWPYAMAHGLQYLVFMGVTSARSRFGWIGLAGMAAITLAATQLAGLMPRGLYVPIWTGLVIWHFVADARLWRVSDPAVRAVVMKRFDFVFASKLKVHEHPGRDAAGGSGDREKGDVAPAGLNGLDVVEP